MASWLAGWAASAVAQPLWAFLAALFAIAGLAVPLLAVALLLLARRWLAGLSLDQIYMACLLAAPALLMGGISLVTLARDPGEWTTLPAATGEAPRRVDERWRHMLPHRPPRDE